MDDLNRYWPSPKQELMIAATVFLAFHGFAGFVFYRITSGELHDTALLTLLCSLTLLLISIPIAIAWVIVSEAVLLLIRAWRTLAPRLNALSVAFREPDPTLP